MLMLLGLFVAGACAVWAGMWMANKFDKDWYD